MNLLKGATPTTIGFECVLVYLASSYLSNYRKTYLLRPNYSNWPASYIGAVSADHLTQAVRMRMRKIPSGPVPHR